MKARSLGHNCNISESDMYPGYVVISDATGDEVSIPIKAIAALVDALKERMGETHD